MQTNEMPAISDLADVISKAHVLACDAMSTPLVSVDALAFILDSTKDVILARAQQHADNPEILMELCGEAKVVQMLLDLCEILVVRHVVDELEGSL